MNFGGVRVTGSFAFGSADFRVVDPRGEIHPAVLDGHAAAVETLEYAPSILTSSPRRCERAVTTRPSPRAAWRVARVTFKGTRVPPPTTTRSLNGTRASVQPGFPSARGVARIRA